jgi:Ca-activated chloride channel homolog
MQRVRLKPPFRLLVLAIALGACSAASSSDPSWESATPPRGAGSSPTGGPTTPGGNNSGASPSSPGSGFGGSSSASTGGSSGGYASGSGGASGSAPVGAADAGAGVAPGPGNTNIALGGAQDFGYFRRLLADGRVPEPKDFDAAGFFAEHHTKLPPPVCGQRICLQNMLAVMTNLSSSASCTMLQLGLNSTLVADPTMRPPLNLVLAIDVSGSMNTGNKIGFVRDGLSQLIDGMRDTDKLAIITYSNGAQVIEPMGDVALRRAHLRSVVQALVADGSTALHDGLKLAYQEALKHHDSGRQNRVILLSDGQPTVGITNPVEIVAMSRGYNSDGVGLTTVGVGTDFNPVLMRELAQQADGNTYFVENAAAVNEVFTDELSYFTVPVAFDLTLELSAGSQYNFGRAYGSSFWKNVGLEGGALAVPSVFLAHRKSHDDQTPQGGRRGGGSALLIELMPKRTSDDGSGITAADVATVKLKFREPGTNRIVTDEIKINYPNPPWVTPERGFFASQDLGIVQKSFVMLNIYTAIEEASREFHTGDRRPIIGRLNRLRAAVVDYNEEINDQDIVADIKLLDDLIAVLRRNGVVDPQAPIPTNPWPVD